MKPAVRATRDFILFLILAAAFSSLCWYAGTHPWFATNILMPIIGVMFFVGVWMFFFLMAKSR